ncbi:MAG: ABC transporter ATP-binding protein, partial [Chloroflexi bacterium]|nr:ABC transporter ATP-binding protein [Chloroflexota bacterium]
LDEPTSALDPLGRRDVRDLLRRLRDDGVTVFLSSHLLSEVEQICDDVAIMAAGEIVRSGSLPDLLARQLELEIRVERVNAALLRALEPFGQPVVDQDETVRVLLDRESVVPDVAAAILSVGGRLQHLALRRLTLEDLFVEAVRTPAEVVAR